MVASLTSRCWREPDTCTTCATWAMTFLWIGRQGSRPKLLSTELSMRKKLRNSRINRAVEKIRRTSLMMDGPHPRMSIEMPSSAASSRSLKPASFSPSLIMFRRGLSMYLLQFTAFMLDMTTRTSIPRSDRMRVMERVTTMTHQERRNDEKTVCMVPPPLSKFARTAASAPKMPATDVEASSLDSTRTSTPRPSSRRRPRKAGRNCGGVKSRMKRSTGRKTNGSIITANPPAMSAGRITDWR
mmetsp:Transcript_23723/g.52595  ORF Transcript_23723/g.52595 Transcript_23723/m.52595 type:complete len:242 (+) Transcript_23723:444-1169(+)